MILTYFCLPLLNTLYWTLYHSNLLATPPTHSVTQLKLLCLRGMMSTYAGSGSGRQRYLETLLAEELEMRFVPSSSIESSKPKDYDVIMTDATNSRSEEKTAAAQSQNDDTCVDVEMIATEEEILDENLVKCILGRRWKQQAQTRPPTTRSIASAYQIDGIELQDFNFLVVMNGLPWGASAWIDGCVSILFTYESQPFPHFSSCI